MYLGELSRLLTIQLATAGALFVGDGSTSPRANSPLYTPWALTTAHCSDIVGDQSGELQGVSDVLTESMGISRTTLQDRRVVQEVCTLVARRAARLAAVGVAAVITQMGPDGEGAITAIDGSVFKKFPGYRQVRPRPPPACSHSRARCAC